MEFAAAPHAEPVLRHAFQSLDGNSGWFGLGAGPWQLPTLRARLTEDVRTGCLTEPLVRRGLLSLHEVTEEALAGLAVDGALYVHRLVMTRNDAAPRFPGAPREQASDLAEAQVLHALHAKNMLDGRLARGRELLFRVRALSALPADDALEALEHVGEAGAGGPLVGFRVEEEEVSVAAGRRLGPIRLWDGVLSETDASYAGYARVWQRATREALFRLALRGPRLAGQLQRWRDVLAQRDALSCWGCGAETSAGRPCRLGVVNGRAWCRLHGGAGDDPHRGAVVLRDLVDGSLETVDVAARPCLFATYVTPPDAPPRTVLCDELPPEVAQLSAAERARFGGLLGPRWALFCRAHLEQLARLDEEYGAPLAVATAGGRPLAVRYGSMAAQLYSAWVPGMPGQLPDVS